MGILANHVPSIEQLRPGLLEVIEDANNTKKYFGKAEEGLEVDGFIKQMKCIVSGGFAVVQPGSLLSVNAVEANPLEDFSPEVGGSRVDA